MDSVLNVIQNKIDSIDSDVVISNRSFKFMRFIALIYMTLLLAATVCAYKIVEIGIVPEPGSTLIFTCSFFWGNVFAEVYGADAARKLIWESVICGFLFAILVTIVNCLPSPGFWENQQAYNKVLGDIFRFTTAGTIGYLLSAFINVYLLTHWKLKMKGRLFWLRSFCSSVISEAVATFIAGIITFFNMISIAQILYVMTCALIFKILYSIFAVWPASFVVFLLKKKEGLIGETSALHSFKFEEKLIS